MENTPEEIMTTFKSWIDLQATEIRQIEDWMEAIVGQGLCTSYEFQRVFRNELIRRRADLLVLQRQYNIYCETGQLVLIPNMEGIA